MTDVICRGPRSDEHQPTVVPPRYEVFVYGTTTVFECPTCRYDVRVPGAFTEVVPFVSEIDLHHLAELVTVAKHRNEGVAP